MAGSGYLRSTILRDIKDTQDSLKRMIRELKRGRRRLRSEINAAIRKLEECKRMRDELNDLSFAISSYTHSETTLPETNTNGNFLSLEEYLMMRQNENIDLMDNDDENTVPPKSGMEIFFCTNRSDMPVENLQSPVRSVPSMKSITSIKSFSSIESFTSIESGDSSAKTFDSTVENTDSSVESFHSSMDYTDFSEDEFLDADDDIYDIFGHCSTHWCVEGSVSEDIHVPVSTISSIAENSQSLEEEITNCEKEDVISVCTNEYKKIILSAPTNMNIFENVQDRKIINISKAALTNDNSERLEREEIEDLKRKSSRTSSLSSNTNFSDDSSKIIIWSLGDPFEHDFREAVTEKKSNSPKGEEVNDKEENYLGINSYPETKFSKDPFMSFLPKPIIIRGFTDNSSEKDETEECSFRKKCFSGASKNSKMHFSEDFPKDEKLCKNNETNIGEISKSSIGKDFYNEELVSDLEVDSYANLYFSESLKHEELCLNNETMKYDDSDFPKREELVDMKESFNTSSTSLNMSFLDDSLEESSWCMNIGTIATEHLKPVKKDQFAVTKFKLLEKDDELDNEEDAFDCSCINSYPEINCYENLQEEIINKLVKVENENCKCVQREKMNLKKEDLNDLWMNAFDKKNPSDEHQKQMNEIAIQMLTKKFSHPEENFEHHHNEDEGMVPSHYLSSFESLIDRSENCPRNMESSENIRNSSENKFDSYYNENIEFPDFSSDSQSTTFPANAYDDTKLHEFNIAVLNDDLHPVEREVKDIGIKIKSQDENAINSLSEISWKNICEKAETMKQFSDFSTDGLNHTAKSAPHFGDKNTLTGSLDTGTLSEVISNCPSHEDVSVHLNAVKRLTEDSVALEIQNTKPFASSSEKPEPTKINHVNNILNKDKAE